MSDQVGGIHTDPSLRHDAVLLFDVVDGNPNGDPDAGNMPRVDPETMDGLVTDVAIKRKVRDWVDVARGEEERFKIYVQHLGYLNRERGRAYTALGLKKDDTSKVREARSWMCNNFYDIRTFGGVLSMKEYNCGQVRGPVQVTFARSIDPVSPVNMGIARVAIEESTERPKGGARAARGNAANAVAEPVVAVDDSGAGATHGTFGRKSFVPYGLYRAHIFINPHFARDTGFSTEDLGLFWQAVQRTWDSDHSAARGMMSCRGLYVFSHESPYGNAAAHELFERITHSRLDSVEIARRFADYAPSIDDTDLPPGVTLTRLVG